jgi:Tfp pilus assembly protein PilE
MRADKQCNAGIALIELLVVAAITAVIVSTFSPLYLRAFEKSREDSDIASMLLARLAAEELHAEGKLTAVANSMFYDSETGRVVTTIPEGYGRGTVTNAGESYELGECECSYDPARSYKDAYLTVYYDTETQDVHVHWVSGETRAEASSTILNNRKKKGDRDVAFSFCGSSARFGQKIVCSCVEFVLQPDVHGDDKLTALAGSAA